MAPPRQAIAISLLISTLWAFGVTVCLSTLVAAQDSRSEEPALGSVSGRVASADSGYGLRNASVILLDLQTAMHTDDEGAFRFDQVPPGNHTLRIRSAGFLLLERTVTVASGANSLGTIGLGADPAQSAETRNSSRVIPKGRNGIVGSKATASAKDIQMLMRVVGREPTVGDRLAIRAQIYNLGKSEVVLPICLDGSDGLRFPNVRVRVEGPEGGFVVKPYTRVKTLTPLRARDLVTVKGLSSLDPFVLGWVPANLKLGRIKKTGKYRVVVEYSTNEPDANKWLGDMSKESYARSIKHLSERLELVPPVELADSVNFIVRW